MVSSRTSLLVPIRHLPCLSSPHVGRRFSSAGGETKKKALKEMIIPLSSKKYFEITGRDCFKFLQGIVTHDIRLLKKKNDTLACAILTPKGRVLSDIFVYNMQDMKDEEQRVIVEAHAGQAKAVGQYLSLYKLRSKVKIKEQEYQTFFSMQSIDQIQNTISSMDDSFAAEDKMVVITEDPRTDGFGSRILLSENLEQAFRGSSSVSFAHPGVYDTYRLLWGLGEGSEIEGKIPLECNLDLTNQISFNKGCYLGQELTARTKYKGVVRKRIVPIVVSNNQNSMTESSNISKMKFMSDDEPIFPVLNENDIQELMDYFISCQKDKSSPKKKSDSGVDWIDSDELIPWNKIRILQALLDEKNESKSAGKVVCMDHHYKQNQYRVGLGHLNLSTLSGKSLVKDGSFSILNEEQNWTLPTYVLRPRWWPDKDPVSGSAVIPE